MLSMIHRDYFDHSVNLYWQNLVHLNINPRLLTLWAVNRAVTVNALLNMGSFSFCALFCSFVCLFSLQSSNQLDFVAFIFDNFVYHQNVIWFVLKEPVWNTVQFFLEKNNLFRGICKQCVHHVTHTLHTTKCPCVCFTFCLWTYTFNWKSETGKNAG